MPVYQYDCDCGQTTDQFRMSEARDEPLACACGGEARRRFTPCVVHTPAHFGMKHVTMDWCLPAKDDVEGWENRCNVSQVHYRKPEPKETLKDHLMRELGVAREKITLSSGGSGA